VKIKHPTWIDSRIEIRKSSVHGRGAFALAPIRAGEVVTVWAHTVLSPEEVGAVEQGELHRRADGRYVWLPDSWVELDGYDPAEDCLNHSCDPNVWMEDEVTLSARRDIAPGREITGDYALWELDPEHVCPFECRCGATDCRCTITGRDWQLRRLQLRYAGHWHPAIDALIATKTKNEVVVDTTQLAATPDEEVDRLTP